LLAVSTVSAASAAATTTAASVSAASAPAASAMAPAITAAAAPAAFPLGARLVHDERSSQEILAVQGCDCLFSFFIIADFSETESTRLPGESIPKQRE
jgi:hypothetical protein